MGNQSVQEEARLIVFECEGCPVALGIGAISETVPVESAASLGGELVRVSLSDLTGAPPPRTPPATRLLVRLGTEQPPIALEAEACLGIRAPGREAITPAAAGAAPAWGFFQQRDGRMQLTLDAPRLLRWVRESAS